MLPNKALQLSTAPGAPRGVVASRRTAGGSAGLEAAAANERQSRRRHGGAEFVTFVFNVAVSALVIGVASWLSGRFPAAAGFIVALPLSTMLVLPLSYGEHGSAETAIALAKSILLALPITLAFFVPFLLSERLGLSFWWAYTLGCLGLPVGFFLHRTLAAALSL